MKGKIILFIFFGFLCFFPSCVNADRDILRGIVLEIVSEGSSSPFKDSTEFNYQNVKLVIKDENGKESVVDAVNELSRLERGDWVFVERAYGGGGDIEGYSVKEIDRTYFLLSFLFLFLFFVISFGGVKGIRSIVSLIISFFVVIYFLVPGIFEGYSPVLISVLVSTFILFTAIYMTHGFNWVSTSAFLGTIFSVLATGFLSYFGVVLAKFTGLGSEESFMLKFYGEGNINFSGLILGATIIGILGVLDDVSITQSAAVRELYKVKKDMEFWNVYKSAMVIGKEHVGAVINTLALAYAGASLPLMLIFYKSDQPIALILSQEVFSVEIMRTIVGSIGLVLAVPITTLLAVYFLRDTK